MAKNDVKFNIDVKVNGKEMINSVTESVNEMGKAMEDAQKDSKGLGQGFADMGKYQSAFNKITESGKPLKRQLREMQKILGEMEFKGLSGTEEFQHMAEQAGSMRDAVDDANLAVKYFADDIKGISSAVGVVQGFVGAFSAVQGAIAMMGVESKEFEKTLLQVQGAMALANGVQQVANTLNKDSALVLGIANMQRKLSIKLAKSHAAAVTTEATATKGATIATRALNLALKANPVGIAITALTALAGVFLLLKRNTDETSESVKKLEHNGHDLADEMGRQAMVQEEVGKKVGDLLSKYEDLRVKFLSCRTEMAQTQFIEANKSGFEALGMNILNAADAMDYFVNKTPAMRNALMKIAIAQGMQDAIKNYTATWAEENAKNPVTVPVIFQGARYNGKKNMNGGVTDYPEWMKEAGIKPSMFTNWNGQEQTFELDAQGLSLARNYSIQKKLTEENKRQSEYMQVISQMADNLYKAESEAVAAADAAGLKYNAGTLKSTSAGTPSVSSAGKTTKPTLRATTAKQLKSVVQKELTELQKMEKQRQEIIAKLANPALTEYERNDLETQMRELSESINFRKKWTADKMYIKDLPDNEAMAYDPLDFDIKKQEEIYKDAAKQISTVEGALDSAKKEATSFFDTMNKGWSSIQGIGGAVSSLNAVLKGNKSAWETICTVVNSLFQIYQGINGVVELINELTGATTAKTAATIADSTATEANTAATVADTAATAAQTAVAATNSAANSTEAVTKAVSEGTKAGYPGMLVAIPLALAAVMAGLAMAGAFAGGGIVSGSSKSGDNMIARVNSGEMIFNSVQQKRLFALLNGRLTLAEFQRSMPRLGGLDRLRASSASNKVKFTLQGRNLVGVLANETRVTSKSGRRTNIVL